MAVCWRSAPVLASLAVSAGFLAGYIAKLISTQLKLPEYGGAETDSDHPLISSLVVGLAMIFLIGKPVAGILEGLTHWLQTMGTANAVLLGRSSVA
ncbi:hypothetical protein ACVXHA_15780 [Escherichia coli]